MDHKEAFALLGLVSGATEEAIDESWKRLSRSTHPDINGSDGSAQALINQARDIASAHSRSLVVYSDKARDLSLFLSSVRGAPDKNAEYDREVERSKKSILDPIRITRQRMLVVTVLAGVLSLLSFDKISPLVDALPNPYPAPPIGPNLQQGVSEVRKRMGLEAIAYSDQQLITSGMLDEPTSPKLMMELEEYRTAGYRFLSYEQTKKNLSSSLSASLLCVGILIGAASLLLTYRLGQKTLEIDAIDEFLGSRSNLARLYLTIFKNGVPESGWTQQDLLEAVDRWTSDKTREKRTIYVSGRKTLAQAVVTSIGVTRFADLLLRKSEVIEIVERASELRAGVPIDVYRFKS